MAAYMVFSEPRRTKATLKRAEGTATRLAPMKAGESDSKRTPVKMMTESADCAMLRSLVSIFCQEPVFIDWICGTAFEKRKVERKDSAEKARSAAGTR